MTSILQDPNLSAFLERRFEPSEHPIALFDCDGTVVRGDVGEAMLYHQIEAMFFKRSPASVWPDNPDRKEIDKLYWALLPMNTEQRAASEEFSRFAELILDWYFGQIERGDVAKACADIVRLLAGFTLTEVREFAVRSFELEYSAPIGTATLGGRKIPTGVRFIREAVELLKALAEKGYEIWALSGSSKWSVEPVFARLGVSADRVIGIEMELNDSHVTSNAVLPIPVREGKVGAMDRVIGRRPAITASDSRNDIPMLLTSTGMKVRINSRGRSATEFFEAVGNPPDASWVNIETPGVLTHEEFESLWQM
jgi:phosphoserine phosphatase